MIPISTVSDYLLDRLAQIGVGHLFGVPGDYNLHFLDHVIAHEDWQWVGCTNELNAAYAADGYARCNGFGALLTTYGVGELSALNGMAGSFAEYVPVIHIVGAPAVSIQQHKKIVHHTLGDGVFDHFMAMASKLACAHAVLTVDNACQEIDRVLNAVVQQRRPGYLLLPSDVALLPIQTAVSWPFLSEFNDSLPSVKAFTEAAKWLLHQARGVTLLTDFLVRRFNLQAEVQKIADYPGVFSANMFMGKGVLNESHPRFVGTYMGIASPEAVRQVVEQAPVLIGVGVGFSDTQTAGFTHNINQTIFIDIQPFSVSIADRIYPDITMKTALTIIQEISQACVESGYWTNDFGTQYSTSTLANITDAPLDQAIFWQQMQTVFRAGDIILAEQGTASFGMAMVPLPGSSHLIVQALWGSIGYTLPATLGVQLAAPEQRVWLLIGDGSAQMSVQELGTLLRWGTKPIIVLINNDGYTIERAIHGPHQPYNDIAPWDWEHILAGFSQQQPVIYHKVTTVFELNAAMKICALPLALTFIEVMLPKYDVPNTLQLLCERIGK